jgi:hypothetical protein
MAKCNALIRGSEDCFLQIVPKKVVGWLRDVIISETASGRNGSAVA